MAGYAGEKGAFPQPYDSQKETIAPLKAEEALAKMKLPEGFRATIFAAEPDLQQPIGMTFDSRGRLWVAENYTYAESALNFDTNLSDRIVIFEDRDGDGRHDGRKVFWAEAKKLTSVTVGFGGVYAMCPPNLLFIPDQDGNDVPDSEPVVLLDGFDHDKIRHTLANGLKWGPDGWIYGRQGIQGTSFVGKPGATREERTAVNGSIWRFHPVRRVFELVAQGTTNPWGMDWDEHGELFFINTVIGHLWHAIPGAYLKRMYGGPFNRYVYEEIEQVADHVHWDTREAWNDINKAISSSTLEAGGGHAHTGLMMYLGDNWPAEYRNEMFTLNFHGKRINHDAIRREGASYTAHHAQDLMAIDDPYFRGIDLLYGPDGGVYVSDWSDIGECHDHNGVHRKSGRIYRITYGEVKKAPTDLRKTSEAELVRLLSHQNEWYVRQARQELQERFVAGRGMQAVREELRRKVSASSDARFKLRALWALYGIEGTSSELLRELLREENEHVRVWAIRLLVEQGAPSEEVVNQFASMAASDKSGLVLCYLASALQRIPLEQRWNVARALAGREEFARDRVLPLMTWYGIEGAIPKSGEETVELVRRSRFDKVRELATRRIFEDVEEHARAAEGIVALLKDTPEVRSALLRGMAEGLEDAQKPSAPKAWAAIAPTLILSNDKEVSQRALELDARFGNVVSQRDLQTRVLETSAERNERRRALNLLVQTKAIGLAELLERLLDDPDLAADAVRGLSAFGSEQTTRLLLDRYPKLSERARREVVNTLVSRPASAKELLSAVQRGVIKKSEISASALRQLRDHDEDAELKEMVALIWATSDKSNSSVTQQFAKYRALLSAENLKRGNASRGRAVYELSCASCHKLYGQGGTVGPELTGADRQNLDYLLENIITPSAVVPDAYRASVVSMKDDRVLNGIVLSKSDQAVTLQTSTEKLSLPAAEVDSVRESQMSMMPDGLLEALEEQQILDLFNYLTSSSPPAKAQ